MQAVRPAARHVRVIRPVARTSLPRTAQRGFRSSARRYAEADSAAVKGGSSGAIAGGLAGGATAALLGYAWYSLSGTKTIVNYAQSSKQQLDDAFKSVTKNAPNSNEAVQWLRETVTSYTRMIPGANQYVDQAFQDIEKLQKNHGDKVNKIVSDTYNELKDVTKNGASMAAASQAWDVLQKCLKRLGDLAGDAAEDIMDEHPELKEKIGGQYKQLKQMADQYGPEAKKEVEDTIGQIKDVLKGGFSSQNIDKARKLVDEKTQALKKYGDKAWDEGLKRAQPVLDKYPELKEQIDNNKDKLLKGDLGQLWNKIQEASKSGNTDDVKNFVQQQISKAGDSASSSFGGLEQYLGSFLGAGGKDLSQKFSQLQELSQKHGKEAENLLKSAFEDVKKVLEQKVKEGEQLKSKVESSASGSSGSGASAGSGSGGSASSKGFAQGDGAAAARRYLGIDRADSGEAGSASNNPAGKVTK